MAEKNLEKITRIIPLDELDAGDDEEEDGVDEVQDDGEE